MKTIDVDVPHVPRRLGLRADIASEEP